MNNAEKILDYWYESEFFSPCWTIDPKTDIDIIKQEKFFPYYEEDPSKQVSFDIYIGKVDVQEVIQWMLDRAGLEDDNYGNDYGNGSCCLCALRMDAEGNYISDSFVVSPFIWAIKQLVANGFESKLDIEELEWLQDYVNKKLGIKMIAIDNLVNFAVEAIFEDIDITIISPEIWAKKEVQYGRYNKDLEMYEFPELPTSTDIIGSFILKDIEKVRSAPTDRIIEYVEALNQPNNHKVEIDVDTNEMEKWLIADKFPLGMWPSEYQPCLMQQIAINISCSNEQRIFSVNGPPGTGKTTMLKEIIVSNIIQRAMVMCEYNHPDDAFEYCKLKEPFQYNKNYVLHSRFYV